MAVTAYGTNHPLAVKLWARKLFEEALKATWFSKFLGTNSNSLIQIKGETQKSAGDQITIGLRLQLTGTGVQGDNTLEGQEEALTTYSDKLIIDQLRHAVRSSGKMSEQRIPFEVRQEAKDGLADWWKDRMDTWFFNQIGGNTAQTDNRYNGLQATIAPDTNHYAVASGSFGGSETSLSATTTMTLGYVDIDRCVAQAKTLTPMIRPLKINGEDHYAMFLHPYQVFQLRKQGSSAGQFIDIQKAAMQGGDIKTNPIFTGAMGIYNNVVLYEAVRIPNTVTANASAVDQSGFRRAVLAGAQAAVIGYGQGGGDMPMEWNEELFDYGNQLGVEVGMIAGLKKTVFNSADFAVLTVGSYAPKP